MQIRLKLLIVLVIFAAFYKSFAQGITFTTTTLVVNHYSPDCVCAADVNGDGYLDLISANTDVPGTLTVLTNNGTGEFGFNSTITSVGNQPEFVVAADVNGDGKMDLITANLDDNTLTVLTNNGNGVFSLSATLPVGNAPYCVAAADVNGDGWVDLVSANMYGNTLTVYTNDGNGGFVFSATLPVGSDPSCVAAIDINGDGKVDLVSANLDGTLTILTNNGEGVFGPNATITVGEPNCVTVADINGDGKPDLICSDFPGYDSNYLTVLTNNGSGGFLIDTTLPLPAGSNPYWVVAADLRGIGKPDLISANSDNDTLTIFTNNGTGNFGTNTTTINLGNSGPEFLLAADLNGDGKPDLVTANATSGDGDTLTELINETVFPVPGLTIASGSQNGIFISWVSPLTGLVLQTNSDLTTANWGDFFPAISTNGSTKTVTLSPRPAGSLFFRLKQ